MEGLDKKDRVARSVVTQTHCFIFFNVLSEPVIVCSPLLAEWSPERVVMEMPKGWKCFLDQRMGF